MTAHRRVLRACRAAGLIAAALLMMPLVPGLVTPLFPGAAQARPRVGRIAFHREDGAIGHQEPPVWEPDPGWFDDGSGIGNVWDANRPCTSDV